LPPISPDKDAQSLLTNLISPLDNIRLRRRYVEEEWMRNYAAWQGWPTVNHFIPLPDGSIRYFVPVARRAIERINSRLVKLLMPSSKWFEVQPFDISDPDSHDKASSVDALFRYVIQKKMKYKPIVSSLTRCLQLYSFSCLHTSPKVLNDEVWPNQRVVDPFSFYVFPETAQDISEVSLIFEDIYIPFEIYSAMTNPADPNQGFALPLNPNKLQAPIWPWHLIERLSYRGLTAPDDFYGGSTDQGYLIEKDFSDRKSNIANNLSSRSRAFVQLTSVNIRLGGDWYKAWIVYNYLDDRDEPFKSHDGSHYTPKVVKLDKVEGNPKYQWAAHRNIPGELYTNSMMDDIRVLQILANNQISQVEANRAVVAEPPVGINVSEGTNRAQSYRYAPRAKWETDGNPNEFIKNLDVKDTGAEGLRAWQVSMGLINSSAGAGTIAEGQPGRNMPRAGFAVNSLINLALSDIQDLADTVEQCLLSPGLSDIWHTLVEYTPKSQLFNIPGIAKQAGKYFTTSDLYGDYQFSWMGTLQFQDANTRADRLMKFLEILGNPQIAQILQSQGKQVDLGSLLEMIWMEGLGERGLRNVIIPAQQAPPEGPNPLELQQMQADLQSKQMDLQSKAAESQINQKGQVIDLQKKMQDAQMSQAQGTQDLQRQKMEMIMKLLQARQDQAQAQSQSSEG